MTEKTRGFGLNGPSHCEQSADSGSTTFLLVVQWAVRKLGNSRMVIQKLDVKSDNFTEMCVFCFVLLL